jgi:hypothetical protein
MHVEEASDAVEGGVEQIGRRGALAYLEREAVVQVRRRREVGGRNREDGSGGDDDRARDRSLLS